MALELTGLFSDPTWQLKKKQRRGTQLPTYLASGYRTLQKRDPPLVERATNAPGPLWTPSPVAFRPCAIAKPGLSATKAIDHQSLFDQGDKQQAHHRNRYPVLQLRDAYQDLMLSLFRCAGEPPLTVASATTVLCPSSRAACEERTSRDLRTGQGKERGWRHRQASTLHISLADLSEDQVTSAK